MVAVVVDVLARDMERVAAGRRIEGADTAARFLIAALRKTGSSDPAQLAPALSGMEIASPVGMLDGKIVMRAEDKTIIDYALGWGRIVPKEPYLVDIEPADWAEIVRIEAAWKKEKGFA